MSNAAIRSVDNRSFFIVYKDVIEDIGDPTAIAMYNALLSFADDEKFCYPSVKKLAERIGLSTKNLDGANRALKILIDKGYVAKFNRWKNTRKEISCVKSSEFNIPTSNGYFVYSYKNCGGSFVDPTADSVGTPTADSVGLTITNKNYNQDELNNSLPSLRDSAAEGAALVPLGDPQAGTPTHTNRGALQPVNESDPQGRRQGRGKPSKRQLGEEFEKFWALVGRKRGKQQARKSFEKQRRTHDLEFICSQLMKAQAEWVRTGREPEYWPHPSTWLNQQLDDDYDTTSVPSQREFYEARVQMIREQHVREKAQLNAIADDVSMPAITSTCVEEDDEDDDDDDWDWGA